MSAAGGERCRWLHSGWRLADTAAGAADGPEALARADVRWREAVVPGTVAQSLGQDVSVPGPHDARDWWYRCEFDADPARERILCFEGLATRAEAWLNGKPLLKSRNMFTAHERDVSGLLAAKNELVIRFGSLDAELLKKRPRPRWKTALVAEQNLRWERTTLLGRIPGWSPPIEPVGPWRGIRLGEPEEITELRVRPRARAGVAVLELEARVRGDDVTAASLEVGSRVIELPLRRQAGETSLGGIFELPEVPLWWPHTHGEPARVDCRLRIARGGGAARVRELGRLGFREVEALLDGGRVALRINGVEVFCRGACWTPPDVVSLAADEPRLRALLTTARDGGLNLIRVGGTMVYESDEFYRLCDELGILVWQDFMFANMDYPVADEEFHAEIAREAAHQLARLSGHASLAAYCGGSEVQQQAAMLGLPPGEWSNPFFDRELPALCAELHPGVPYFPSTPCGGALPFHTSQGLSHYYGVGAYLRPLTDARLARVRFTPECLGFSNLPEREAMELGGHVPAPHTPAWKARVPRDSGAGWDFEDVRDHYLGELFGVDPVRLRGEDLERYHDLSAAVSGEVMRRVYAEWRRPGSGCAGALVWFLKDLWPGAGWGVLASCGAPKPVWHSLKRAWAPQAVLITDEGLEGLGIHLVNDSARPLRAVVSLELFARQRIRTAAPEREVEVPARGGLTLQADEWLGHFADLAHAYRFGPSKYDVIRASIRCAETGRLIGEDFHFPAGLGLARLEGQVEAEARVGEGGRVSLRLKSRSFLQSVRVAAKGYAPSDNHFHLAPETEKTIWFAPSPGLPGAPKPFKAEVSALNLWEPLVVRPSPEAPPATREAAGRAP